jgi:hypothetical protein
MFYAHLLKKKAFLMSVLLSLSLLLVIGCSIGLKEQQTIIYSSLAPVPAELNGALKVAQNEEILVSVEGKEKILTKMKAGGMYLISAQDLQYLIQKAKK